MNIRIYALVAVFTPFVMLSVCIAGSVLPNGWRYPTEEETADGLIKWRHEHPRRFLYISDDFNGDGVLDESKLLVSDEENKMALFVFISNGSKHKQIILVEQEKVWIARMGIQVADPGEYQTVCGKGYFACESGLPDVLVLKYPAIDFFKFASANVYFYWDGEAKKFKSIQISD